MNTIIFILAIVAVIVGVLYIRRKTSALSDPTPSETTRPSTAPEPAAPKPTDPVEHALGPDSQGRIRIPEVEALGGDWTGVWWYAPWSLHAPRSTVYDKDTTRWQVRYACGCDDNGVLGPAPGRGFETGTLGSAMTVYSWQVPKLFRRGTDRYGRSIVFMASVNDVHNADGTWTQQKQIAEPVRITDKLTRATRAKDGVELAAWLKANPQVKPIPDSPVGGPWVPTDAA